MSGGRTGQRRARTFRCRVRTARYGSGPRRTAHVTSQRHRRTDRWRDSLARATIVPDAAEAEPADASRRPSRLIAVWSSVLADRVVPSSNVERDAANQRHRSPHVAVVSLIGAHEFADQARGSCAADSTCRVQLSARPARSGLPPNVVHRWANVVGQRANVVGQRANVAEQRANVVGHRANGVEQRPNVIDRRVNVSDQRVSESRSTSNLPQSSPTQRTAAANRRGVAGDGA